MAKIKRRPPTMWLTKKQLFEICKSVTGKSDYLFKNDEALMQLPAEQVKEIYYMIKGAALVAHSR